MSGSLAATGLFGNALQALKRLVASSSHFQALVGAADEDAAMASIHAPEASDRDDGSKAAMPRAIVSISDFNTHNSGSATWSNNGNLDLCFEFVPPEEYASSSDDSYSWFVTKIGEIIDDMRAKSGHANENPAIGSYINLRTLQLIDGPAQALQDEEEGELFYGVCFSVSWM